MCTYLLKQLRRFFYGKSYTNNKIIGSSVNAIVFSGPLEEDTIAKFYDINGRLVLEQGITAMRTYNTLAIGRLQSGIYILELSNTKQHHTQKIIID